MNDPFGAQPDKKKAAGLADAINRLLQNLVIKCAKAEGIREYFYVGVLGYGNQVGPALGGPLAGKPLVPISQVANQPLRVETRTKKVDDGAGSLIEKVIKFPVWFEPVAFGKTPMCRALQMATEIIADFLRRQPGCYPPIVLNITDGEANDGDPELAAAAVRELASGDGNVLLFNAHISGRNATPIEFPDSDKRPT